MNPLQTTYNETVKTQRFEAESGSDIEGYEDFILSVPCHIQPIEVQPNAKSRRKFRNELFNVL